MERPQQNVTSFCSRRTGLTLLVLTLGLLLADTLASIYIYFFAATLPVALQIVIDVTLTLLAISPLLYCFALRPLQREASIRRETEAALAKSEERSRILADSLHDATLELDAGMRVSHLGTALSSFIGYPPDEVIGRPATDFLAEAAKQTLSANLADVIAEHELSGARSLIRCDDYELLRNDGSTVWAEITSTVLFNEDGGLERIIGAFRDISDRKQVELTLHNAHILLQKTISSLNEAVFIVANSSRRIQEVNICAEKMFGYTREELIGAPTSILHLGDQMYQCFRDEMSRSYNEKGYFQTTHKMKRKDGTVFPAEHYTSPIITEDGNYQSHVCVVRDISERVQAEESLAKAFNALEERKAFVESIIANLHSGIIVTDLDFKITMTNPYVQDMAKLPVEQILGMKLDDFCPELGEQVAAGVNSNEIIALFNGVELTIGFNRLDMKNAARNSVGHIINFRDLTEIVKIRSMIHQKDRLSAMGEVVAGVAHEMRNPLFGMTTVGQILDMELTLSPQHQQLMDSFMKESRRLNNLVQDLLDGTRELKLRKKLINLSAIIDASIQVCKKFLQEKNIALTWEHPANDIILLADPEKLEQVFVNLIHNAVDACDHGSGIDILMKSTRKSIIVKVIDTGHGIPEKILPNIFDVFFTSKKSGTGMGLYISKNIAVAHGGTLTAANLPEKGAEFILTLPVNGDQP